MSFSSAARSSWRKPPVRARGDGHGAVEAPRMRDRERPVVGEALAAPASPSSGMRAAVSGSCGLWRTATRSSMTGLSGLSRKSVVSRTCTLTCSSLQVAALRIPVGGEAEHLRVQRADMEARPLERQRRRRRAASSARREARRARRSWRRPTSASPPACRRSRPGRRPGSAGRAPCRGGYSAPAVLSGRTWGRGSGAGMALWRRRYGSRP